MNACPTCRKTNCGNHAACARRFSRLLDDLTDRIFWMARWQATFWVIAEIQTEAPLLFTKSLVYRLAVEAVAAERHRMITDRLVNGLSQALREPKV